MTLVLVLTKGDASSLPRMTSKYSKEFTNEMTGRIAVVLAEAPNGMTVDEIQAMDMNLVGITPQKMARMIGHLVEMGMVAKSKGRDGRMRYRSLASMEADGIDIEPYKYGNNMLDKGGKVR